MLGSAGWGSRGAGCRIGNCGDLKGVGLGMGNKGLGLGVVGV